MRRLLVLLALLPLAPAVGTGPAGSVPIPPPTAPVTISAPSAARTTAPAYARLLSRHVRRGTIAGRPLQLVDYAALARDPDLTAALDELARARTGDMTRDERLAFWINAYNLLAIRLVADAYPVASMQDIRGAFDRVAGTAAGRRVSLTEIENEILREELREPRIHAALVAAALGCPDLRGEPYDGARIDAQLEEAMRAFLADTGRGVRRRADGKVEVSPLFHGFHEDFGRRGIADYIRRHAPAEVAAWLEGLTDHDLGHIPYDWSMNDLARADVSRP